MNPTSLDKIVIEEELHRIALQLLRSSLSDEDFDIFWNTMNVNNSQHVWAPSVSLYSGVSGIALFLLEYYRYCKDEIFLQVAIKAARWLEKQPVSVNAELTQSFHTGVTGLAYFFVRMWDITGDSQYKSIALKLANSVSPDIDINVFDFLNGTAGTLLGLLHVFSATKDEAIYSKIFQLIDILLNNIKIYGRGIYWDLSGDCIKPLCGLSHGTSGIGFVLDEAANYFSLESLKTIASFSRMYENMHFDEALGNWPDFRKGFYDKMTCFEHNTEYENLNLSFFTQPQYANAWCHGALGIAFTRLRAYLLSDKAHPSLEHLSSLNLIKSSEFSNIDLDSTFTLCHGWGAFIEFFLCKSEVEFLDSDLETIKFLITKLRSTFFHNNKYLSGFNGSKEEDLSLFMGISGIGYTLLRVLDPEKTPSMVLPSLNGLVVNNNKKKLHETQQLDKYTDQNHTTITILNRTFPRTLLFIDKLDLLAEIAGIGSKCLISHQNIIDCLQENIEVLINRLEYSERNILYDVFKLELIKARCYENVNSFCLLNIERIWQNEHIQSLLLLGNEELFEMQFSINPRIIIHFCENNWHNDYNFSINKQHMKNMRSRYTVLLSPTPEGVSEYWLTRVSESLLLLFQTRISCRDAYKIFIDLPMFINYDLKSVSDFFFGQLKELISARVVLDNKTCSQASLMMG